LRALITGGAGFIGSHLAEALLASGHDVTCIDNLSTGKFDNIAHLENQKRFTFAFDSITNQVVTDRLVSECDVIFHLAAAVGVELIIRDPVHVIETNVLGTHAILKVANRYRKKVLIASTSEIYGKNLQVPFNEEDDRIIGPTTRARWSYSDSKAVDEFLGLAYNRQMGLPVVIVRLFNTVGIGQTGQYGMVVPRFVQQAIQGERLTVFGDGQQSRCFCDVDDVVRGIIGLVEHPEAVGQVFNIGSQEEITIFQLAEQVLRIVDNYSLESDSSCSITGIGTDDSRIELVPYDQAYEPGFEDMRRRIPDIQKINTAIGWTPTIPLEKTLERIV